MRNIIQHFENNQHYESQEPGSQRLSTGSFPEDLLEGDGEEGLGGETVPALCGLTPCFLPVHPSA